MTYAGRFQIRLGQDVNARFHRQMSLTDVVKQMFGNLFQLQRTQMIRINRNQLTLRSPSPFAMR